MSGDEPHQSTDWRQPNVRAAAAEAFERLPHERAIDRLRALLRDVDVVRGAAARTLHRRWVPSLDLEEDVLRALAADRFSATGAAERLPPAAKPLLVRLARTGDLAVRERSLRALGHRREDDAVLMEALISPHVELRRAATSALAQICASGLEDDGSDISDEEWRHLWRVDEVSPPIVTFPCVALPLRAGEVVRLTDERGERWAGEWNEVIVTDEELAGVRGIMDEFDTIAIEELLARGRRHPDPRRWKARAADWRRAMARVATDHCWRFRSSAIRTYERFFAIRKRNSDVEIFSKHASSGSLPGSRIESIVGPTGVQLI